MRIGVMLDTERPFEQVVAQAAGLRDSGVETAWLSQIFALDALTAIAAVGREVPGIGFGTAVVPTYPRHPVMLAGQALTVQAATGGRLTLGIGLSHQLV
ncbi:MAG TPA: LLM class flavin-dependent oxidoreductase, partial [Acidimicrobiales bacterium]